MNNTQSTTAVKTCYQKLSENFTNKKVFLIDVRTPGEYEQIHANHAKLYPLSKLNPQEIIEDLSCKNHETIYIICESGGRAKQAQEKFVKAGYDNTSVVEGGTQAWNKANLPVVESERKVISLQRQVQIAAGGIILTGVLLSITVHPLLIGITAFVGIGLIFAGLSNTCGMAILLAKMPWNNPKDKCVKNCACKI